MYYSIYLLYFTCIDNLLKGRIMWVTLGHIDSGQSIKTVRVQRQEVMSIRQKHTLAQLQGVKLFRTQLTKREYERIPIYYVD